MTAFLACLLTAFVVYSVIITAVAIYAAGELNAAESKRKVLEAKCRRLTGYKLSPKPDFEKPPPAHSPMRGYHRPPG